ncbi:MAG: RHS repeat-associated core domain-containing protein, partial [Terriglobia bacterium]
PSTEDPTFGGLLGDDRYAGLDPAPFREYSPGQGRWLTPDPVGGDLTNPQSLNRYAYALNNPESLTDPSGLCPPDEPCGHLLDPSTCDGIACAGSLSGGGGQDEFELLQLAAGMCLGNCTDAGGVQFTGYLDGQYVNTTFDSWDDYASWRTAVAALPQNEIYDAFWALLENNGLNPNTEFGVFGYQQGPTWNVQLLGYPLNTANAAQGRIPDPYHGVHAGNSWYGLSPVNTLHLVDDPKGAEAHFDLFNGVLLFPLHELFDYLPSLFINPKSQVPQPSVNWYCSGNGGCHQ